jgi:hypothetical protein
MKPHASIKVELWQSAIHGDRVFVVASKKIVNGDRLYFDHLGTAYPVEACKSGVRVTEPMREIWQRINIQPWEGCVFKLGDRVKVTTGNKSGQVFTVEGFDHQERAIGVNGLIYWYKEEYLTWVKEV